MSNTLVMLTMMIANNPTFGSHHFLKNEVTDMSFGLVCVQKKIPNMFEYPQTFVKCGLYSCYAHQVSHFDLDTRDRSPNEIRGPLSMGAETNEEAASLLSLLKVFVQIDIVAQEGDVNTYRKSGNL